MLFLLVAEVNVEVVGVVGFPHFYKDNRGTSFFEAKWIIFPYSSKLAVDLSTQTFVHALSPHPTVHFADRLQGFAFVTFYTRADAEKAIEKVSGFGYNHLILQVEWARCAVHT